MVWGIIKRHYDANIGRDGNFGEAMMRAIFGEALDRVTQEIWQACCEHTEKKILEDYEREVGPLGDRAEDMSLVIDLGDDEGDDDEDEDDWESDPDDPDDPASVGKGNSRKSLFPESVGLLFVCVLW